MSDKQLKSKMSSVPIWKKMNLTVEEASEYSGIGASKIKAHRLYPSEEAALAAIGKNKVEIPSSHMMAIRG